MNSSVSPRRPSVLWIDDEPSVIGPLVLRLTNSGFKVQTVCDGRSALELARRDRPDVVILDYQMPGMSGIDVARGLRSYAVGLPIVVLTGHGTEEVASQFGYDGATSYHEKPIRSHDLIAIVRFELARAASKWQPTTGLSDFPTQALKSLFPFAPGHTRPGALSAFARRAVACNSDVRVILFCAEAMRALAQASDERVESVLSGLQERLELLDATRLGDYGLEIEEQLSRFAEGKLQAVHHLRRSRSLRRLMTEKTGFQLREWKWTYALRDAIAELANTDEQSSQIAYKHGYRHASQFNRDFLRLFGVSPGLFRQLAR